MFYHKINSFEEINKHNTQLGTYIFNSYAKYINYIPIEYNIYQVIKIGKKHIFYKIVAKINKENIITSYYDEYTRSTTYKDEYKVLPKEYNYLIDKIIVFG